MSNVRINVDVGSYPLHDKVFQFAGTPALHVVKRKMARQDGIKQVAETERDRFGTVS